MKINTCGQEADFDRKIELEQLWIICSPTYVRWNWGWYMFHTGLSTLASASRILGRILLRKVDCRAESEVVLVFVHLAHIVSVLLVKKRIPQVIAFFATFYRHLQTKMTFDLLVRVVWQLNSQSFAGLPAVTDSSYPSLGCGSVG